MNAVMACPKAGSLRVSRPPRNRGNVIAFPNRMTESGTEVDVESDNELLERAGRNDRAAFERFYDRFSTPLYSLAVQMLGDATEAEDALLEGMETIWRKAPTFDPSLASAFTWSVMIFRSRVVDRARRRSSRNRTKEGAREEKLSQLGPLGEVSDEAELPARREEWQLVRDAVDSLDEAQSTLLKWSFFDGMTHQEIAEKSGRPLGTIKTTIRRSLIELRARVTGKGMER